MLSINILRRIPSSGCRIEAANSLAACKETSREKGVVRLKKPVLQRNCKYDQCEADQEPNRKPLSGAERFANGLRPVFKERQANRKEFYSSAISWHPWNSPRASQLK